MHTTLVSAASLQQHLDDPRWRVFDARHDLFDLDAGRRAYRDGHIPGAQFARIDDDLSGTKTGRNGRHPLPQRAVLAERFRTWGIDRDTQIVVYDAHGGQFAGRLWWLARWLGHHAVAVLDGGWPAWLAAGGATDNAVATPQRGDFVAGEPITPAVTASQLAAALATKACTLVDARLPERYRGEQEPIDPVAGHIPGAFNRPWTHNLTADQRFKGAELLRQELLALLGTRPAANVVFQCGSGVTACHHLLAMEVAGLPGASLYAGSWSEWIADPARPVATGAQP